MHSFIRKLYLWQAPFAVLFQHNRTQMPALPSISPEDKPGGAINFKDFRNLLKNAEPLEDFM